MPRIAIALVLVSCVASCSFVAVTGPPKPMPRLTSAKKLPCTISKVLPALEVYAIGPAVAATGGLLIFEAGTAIGLTVMAIGVLEIVAGAVGLVRVDRCIRALQDQIRRS
jgi:hypothetical protein